MKIERDDSPTDAVTLRLGTFLKSTESSITGPTYERRRTALRDQGLLLGYQHQQWLIANQHTLSEPQKSAIVTLLGKVYIDFPGIVVVNSVGYRFFPCLGQGDKQWGEHWFWSDVDLLRFGRLAISSRPQRSCVARRSK